MINNLTSEAMVTDEAAIVKVNLSVGMFGYQGTGTAKKHPKDEPNPRIGLGLAYARALLDVVDQVVYDTERLIGEANQRRVVKDPQTGEEFAWEDLARKVFPEYFVSPMVLAGSEVA